MTKEEIDGHKKIFLIHDFLTAQECDEFISLSEEYGYDDAPLTMAGGPVMRKDVRNNARYVVDEPFLAVVLWSRAQPFVPPDFEGWKALGLNERFRFSRYDPGQRFDVHQDGYFRRDSGEQSQLTLMVYLNDGFEGGATKFYDQEGSKETASIEPRAGTALVFVHRQWHEGAPVLDGRKYVLRTDVMYEPGETVRRVWRPRIVK